MDLKLNAGELNSFLNGLAPLRHKRARFLFAVATTLVALALTALAQWVLGSTAATVFAICVAISTGLFGLLEGLIATLAAILILDFFFLPPIFAFDFDTHVMRVAVGLSALAIVTHLIERRISAAIRSRAKPPLGMHGSLDGFESGEVFGWAIDADHPTKPLPVTVFVDGHPVAYVKAVYHRSDLGQGMGSAEHGFYVDLAEYFTTDRESVIDVRFPNGRSLPGGPLQVRTPAIAPRERKPTVLLMHIPKTAGTAFRDAIGANFRLSEIAYLYPSAPGFLVNDLRALPLEQLKALRLIIGHFQFGMHEALPQQAEYITVVREPGARVLSQYRYLLQTNPELAKDKNGRALSLPELFEKRLTVNFDNLMVRHFSGVGECDLPPGAITDAIYQRAVTHLRSSFRFVGHQECSSQSYAWLRQHYRWHSTENLPAVNVGAVRLEETPGPDLNAVIRHYNRWDYLLYDEIMKLFPRPDSALSGEAPEPDLTAQR